MTKIEQQYQTVLAAIRSAKPGRPLYDTLAEALGMKKSGITSLKARMASLGYDMSEWDNFAAPGKKTVQSKNDHQYALMMQAAATAKPGTLTSTAMYLLGMRHESTVRLCRKRLEMAGYDMADWHRAAERGPAANASVRAPRPQPKATPQHRRSAAEAPDYVLRRRTEWLADMRRVAAEPGAIDQLSERWNCSRDTVYGRIGVLRNAGHDLTWWTPAPSRGFGDADAITAAVETRPLPVVETQARPSRWAAPIPWTMQAVADVAGVTVLRAMWVGRQHGIPFGTVTLDEATALGLLSALGFTPCERAAA
jgi:hypothetical protein